jgi:hypothetical protein
MAQNKGFGKAKSKKEKEKGEFKQFWIVDGEVWTSDNKTGGTIKPAKETNRYKSGDTEGIDNAIKELAGKADGFYKFGVHEAGSKASWKFDELSTATARAINATKNLIANKKKEQLAMQIK